MVITTNVNNSITIQVTPSGSFGTFFIVADVQGHLAPSSTDSGSSGNIIFDFYW
ncbi:hypothetical protein M8C21_010113, partial [Ambrosia artemisiifolia]